MNWAALLDGFLGLVAFGLAWRAPRSFPAVRLGCLILGSAAVLGALKFSALLPLPSLHQFMSMLGAGVGLPLLAVSVVMPESAVARQRRFAWILGIVLAVACVLISLVAQIKVWPSVCALLAATATLIAATTRKDWLGATAGLCWLLALAAFAGKVETANLRPGEFLHVGLAAGLLLLWLWSVRNPGETRTRKLNPSASRRADA